LLVIAGREREMRAELTKHHWQDQSFSDPSYPAPYLAGLWMVFLISHLGWFKTPSSDANPRRLEGPSWTWASLDAAVVIDSVHVESATLEEYSIDLVNQDAPLGRVSGGKIVLNACIVQHMPDATLLSKGTIVRFDNNKPHTNNIYLLLGMAVRKAAIGLVLQPIDGGGYERVGQLKVAKQDVHHFWQENMKKQIVTVV